MRTVLLLTIVAAMAVAGCHGSAIEVSGRSDEALRESKNDEVLNAYAASRRDGAGNSRLRTEIERRNWFTAEEWDRIDRKTFRLGDKEAVVWAAWGKPDDISTLRTGDAVSRVLIYGDQADNRVYITNGRVSALGQ